MSDSQERGAAHEENPHVIDHPHIAAALVEARRADLTRRAAEAAGPAPTATGELT